MAYFGVPSRGERIVRVWKDVGMALPLELAEKICSVRLPGDPDLFGRPMNTWVVKESKFSTLRENDEILHVSPSRVYCTVLPLSHRAELN
jgi:hypothetical protein